MNSTTGSISGPAGAPQMINVGTPASATTPGNATDRVRLQLHTYIYEYFLKSEQYELARLLSTTLPLRLKSSPKTSPAKKEPNGEDADEKHKDLLPPDVAHHGDEPFLLAWWGQFWDCFNAARHTGSTPARQYMDMIKQQRMANGQRASINPQMQMNLRNQMMQNGAMTAEMKKAAMSGRPFTASQVRSQQQMMQQAQMNREGSVMDMNGPDGQSPMPGDMVPSPKRQRLNDGSFGFQVGSGGPMGAMGQMGQMGRGQPQGIPGQRPFTHAEMQQQMIARNLDPNNPEQQQIFLRQIAQQRAIQQNSMGLGAPGMDPNAMRGPMVPQQKHGALQDYQLQLMLLEQQNKRRLMMARQEQDGVSNGQGHPPGGPGGPGMPGPGFAQPMSPSGSRTGRSPSASEDQAKRSGTPQLGNPGGLQQGPDGAQNFSSPNGGFDANQIGGMYPQMAKMGGMVGPQGQAVPGATSHPNFNGQMNGQFNPQIEAMRQQQARVNGAFGTAGGPNGPNAGMMQMNQPGQPGQAAPNMTPHQRNAAMPPPPAPGQGDAPRTNPVSPQPFNAPAPPTPQPAAAKPPPKKKEPVKKKAANKKNAAASATAATPAASESGEPTSAATPAAAPPMTPTTANQSVPKQNAAAGAASASVGAASAPGPAATPTTSAVAPQSAQSDMMNSNSFGLGGGEYGDMDLSFARVGDGNDVLDNFDFDSFLNQNGTDGDNSFAFDVNMNFDDGAAGAAGGPGGAAPAMEAGAAATDA